MFYTQEVWQDTGGVAKSQLFSAQSFEMQSICKVFGQFLGLII